MGIPCHETSEIAVFGIRHFLCHKIGFNRLHVVSSHETETGNHWKMAILLFGADFSCRSCGTKCRERLFLHFVAMYSVEKCISPVCKTIRDIPERVVVERLR